MGHPEKSQVKTGMFRVKFEMRAGNSQAESNKSQAKTGKSQIKSQVKTGKSHVS